MTQLMCKNGTQVHTQRPMRNTIRAFILLICCILATYACTEKDTESNKEQAKNTSQPGMETLVIGIIPARNIFKQLERYDPLLAYLSQKTGITITPKILTRYGNIIDNFTSSKLDGAFFGSFTYTLARAKLGVEPVARPEAADGHSTYYGVLFVRKDSGIRNAQDMRGKVFAFVDKATTAGYLLPLAFFQENGIVDYKTYFKETYFAGTHENAINDVLDKYADIGAAKNTVFDGLIHQNKRVAEELMVLEKSLPVPENGLALRPDLDKRIRSTLKNALLNMHNDPAGIQALHAFGAKNFIETTDNDYENTYRLVEKVGINLTTYDYLND